MFVSLFQWYLIMCIPKDNAGRCFIHVIVFFIFRMEPCGSVFFTIDVYGNEKKTRKLTVLAHTDERDPYKIVLHLIELKKQASINDLPHPWPPNNLNMYTLSFCFFVWFTRSHH